MSGNAPGLSCDEVQALSNADRAARRAKAVRELTRGGAHYVIDSIADLPAVLV